MESILIRCPRPIIRIRAMHAEALNLSLVLRLPAYSVFLPEQIVTPSTSATLTTAKPCSLLLSPSHYPRSGHALRLGKVPTQLKNCQPGFRFCPDHKRCFVQPRSQRRSPLTLADLESIDEEIHGKHLDGPRTA